MMLKYLTGFVLLLSTSWGCTDLVITSQDGAVINGRSLEFALPLQSQLSVNLRGKKHTSKAPGNTAGLVWTSQYGYLSIDVLGQGIMTDGLNEKGLSVGVLWFPGAEYPHTSKSTGQRSLVLQDLGSWILGRFSSVAEVKEALSEVDIWAEPVPSLGIPPIHLAVHDARGNHLVIEFLNGHVSVTENPNGIMTNFPEIEWQLINLRNYINLTPLNASPMTLGNLNLEPTGQGTGLHGLPGDWTSPSRFVRASLMKAFVIPVPTASLAVNLMEHLLNTFDIPLGVVRGSSDPASFEQTQWIVIKDLKNKILYYRTYEDLTLRYIDLKKLDFSSGRESSLPMTTTPQPIEMTAKLLQP